MSKTHLQFDALKQLQSNKTARHLSQNVRHQVAGRQLASGNHGDGNRWVEHAARNVAANHDCNRQCRANGNRISSC